MKKFINKKISIILLFSVTLLLFVTSCDKMNDVQKKWVDQDELVYLGRVDSTKVLHGFEKLRIVYYLNADPKVEGVITYWNNRSDSVYKAFDRKDRRGAQKDSIEIDGLKEGNMFFEFRTENSSGESSLYSSATFAVWGEDKIASFDGIARTESGSFYDFINSTFLINFSEVPEAFRDSLITHAVLSYTDESGSKIKLRIKNDVDSIEVEHVAPGQVFQLQTGFFDDQSYIDTLFSNPLSITAPSLIEDFGEKLSLSGILTSRYFARDANSFYEWNMDGDVFLYAIENGEINTLESRTGAVPRSSYNQFVYYRSDKFISTTSGNALVLTNFEADGTLTQSTSFGAGFSYPIIIPFFKLGFFYGIDADNIGHAWAVNDDATLGAGPPRGYVPSPAFDFSIYNPLTSYDGSIFIGVDANGDLWFTQVSSDGTLTKSNIIGSGFERFKQLICVGDNLVGIEPNGDMYLFEDFDPNDPTKFLKVD